MKSCMDMVQGVRNEISSKTTLQEDRFTQLRSEVAAEVSALNFDIHGLLEFKNRSSRWNYDFLVLVFDFSARCEKLFRSLGSRHALL